MLEKTYYSNPLGSIEFIKLVIPRITIKKNICYVWYTGDECSEFGLDKETADSLLIDIIRPLKDIPVLCILRKIGDKI